MMAHAGVDPSELPAELRALLDPARPIPEDAAFFPTPINLGIGLGLGVPFTIVGAIGAATLGYYTARDLGGDTPTGEIVLGIGSTLVIAIVTLSIVLGMRTGVRASRALKEGRHRYGVFLSDGWLLVRLGSVDAPAPAWAIGRAAIERVGHRRQELSAEAKIHAHHAVVFYRAEEERYLVIDSCEEPAVALAKRIAEWAGCEDEGLVAVG